MGVALAITGLGCIGAPGSGLAAQAHALERGACHLARADDPRLPLARQLPIGRVADLLPPLPSRTAALAARAGAEALAEAGLGRAERGEVAVVIGSCTAGISESEHDFLERDQQHAWPSYRRQQTHRLTAMVARVLACGGMRSTHSVACASAAAAIAEAAEVVRSGIAPVALAIGADALTRLTMAGFASLQLIDAQGCRPLIRERGGMSLGEGAGALVIEDAAHARARGAPPRASLLGWGLRSDAYHATSPDPHGAQLERAVAEALADAGVAPGAVGYVNAHGTGTADNDACETTTLARLFGAVPTASCKRTYGHTMGAAAAIEAVAVCLALRAQTLWPSAGADLGEALTGVEVVRAGRAGALDVVLSTTLAFAGVNAALVFGRGERAV